MIRRPPRSTQSRSSAASDVYKRQVQQHVQQHMRWHLPSVYSCVVLGFLFFYDYPPPRRASDPSPGGRLSTPPARRVGHRRPFFRRGLRGLLCGAGVELPRGRGRPSGARESQLVFEHDPTKLFSKIQMITYDVTSGLYNNKDLVRIIIILHNKEKDTGTVEWVLLSTPMLSERCSIAVRVLQAPRPCRNKDLVLSLIHI